jgi:hypothetical protein
MSDIDVFDLLTKLENAVETDKRFVYYNAADGSVLHIRNYIEEDTSPYIEVDKKELNDAKSLTDYMVIPQNNKMVLIILQTEWPDFDINNDIYEIEKTNEKPEEYDFLIVQDNKKKNFTISLSKTLCYKLKGIPDQSRDIILYITSENDPNILYSTIFLSSKDLIKGKYAIHKFDLDYDGSVPCNIYTRKLFENYKHWEIQYD